MSTRHWIPGGIGIPLLFLLLNPPAPRLPGPGRQGVGRVLEHVVQIPVIHCTHACRVSFLCTLSLCVCPPPLSLCPLGLSVCLSLCVLLSLSLSLSASLSLSLSSLSSLSPLSLPLSLPPPSLSSFFKRAGCKKSVVFIPLPSLIKNNNRSLSVCLSVSVPLSLPLSLPPSLPSLSPPSLSPSLFLSSPLSLPPLSLSKRDGCKKVLYLFHYPH